MKIEMSERLKHRLTGLVVVISIAIIFLPAMMKKSNQKFERTLRVSVALPQKPEKPLVAIPQKRDLFKTVKVAHVDLPPLPKEPVKIALAEPVKTPVISDTPKPISQLAQIQTPNTHISNKPAGKSINTSVLNKTILNKTELHKTAVKIQAQSPAVKATAASVSAAISHYGVQLASFTQQVNAQQLVNRLRQHGYLATYTPIYLKKGQRIYKVVVGSLAQRDEALHLQKKLAQNLKLSGFIVKTV